MSCPVAMDVRDSFKAAEFEPSSTTGTLVTIATVGSTTVTWGARVAVGRTEGLDNTGTIVASGKAEVLEAAEVLGVAQMLDAVEVGAVCRTVVVDAVVVFG